MLSCLSDLLDGNTGNYLYPFFWQHGESAEVLREYVAAIAGSGCGGFCVEARPHPDFCGEGWWRDMDIILAEAKKRGMKIWILDDAHFPTGYANGALADADPALRKQYLFYSRTDVCGPLPQATVNIAAMIESATGARDAASTVDRDDRLLTVVAGRVGRENRMDRFLDLSAQVSDGMLDWDVPAGTWKLFVLFLTNRGGGRDDYINIIDRRSCRLQIDAVYEAHYARYAKEFGETITGFFSDEPLFGNTLGYPMDDSIGRKLMPLPWSDEVPDMLEERLGARWHLHLPLLWEAAEDTRQSAHMCHAYMDTVTLLAEKNFSAQLGDWCRAHNVEYVGHIIEDNGQHARLGCSMGHYFRALSGQTMAGIDDIGGQVIPGGEDSLRPAVHGVAGDGEFYHFLLGKLAASHAHIDPKKKGRAMCEIFGAYGWGLGVRGMKYLADHFLVRGINRFVPHAFSPKGYPDPDCPPHFYAHGKNPQYRHFSALMGYMNRTCHLLENSVHTASVAVLYHAEAEWAGAFMSNQKPARVLHENQIDFDLLPSDLFANPKAYHAELGGEGLRVCAEDYRALVIPYCQFLTKAVALYAAEAVRRGVPVIFIDALPEGISNAGGEEEERALLDAVGKCGITPLDELAALLRNTIPLDFQIAPDFRRLRYYHGKCEGGEAYLVLNEDPAVAYKGVAQIPCSGGITGYDPFWNKITGVSGRKAEAGMEIELNMPPLGMMILLVDPAQPAPVEWMTGKAYQRRALAVDWTLSIAKSEEYPHFHDHRIISECRSVTALYPDFSGFMRYETEVDLTGWEPLPFILELEDAYEGVEVWVNNANAGICISSPYRFPIERLVTRGKNHIRIEVANSLARENHDIIEKAVHIGRESKVLAPSGIVGDVFLLALE